MDIDPNALSIILGLITNGLTSLIAVSSHKTSEFLIGKEFLEKWELEKTALQPILHKAISSITENVEWQGSAREEVVSLFLLSPEVEEIVRQIYATKLVGDKGRGDLASIRKIFLTSFTLFTASYPSDRVLEQAQLADSANYLLDALIKGCDLALDSATDKGILAAHEAKSAFRHNVIHSEIEAIQKKLDFLIAQQQINIPAILDFEKKYRQQVGNRHSHITPPNFDSARKLSIDALYVYSNFITTPKKKEDKKSEEPEALKMSQFISRIYRAVLLGNPGGGKSTLTLKLCHDLATDYSERLFAGRKELTPILVVLRNYGADKKERNCSILEFIEAEAKANYQLSSPPPGAFEYLLLSGRAVVIFDGLDELLDTGYRQEIRSDVESFCNLYPSVPVLVTSREIGYEQAPLDEKMFEVFRLSPFDEDQVQEYVQKWFNVADVDITPKQRQQKVETFLQESRSVSDLRSNPLMLALMCNIYRGENYIPKNRPDVYEKCATMLFERWDKSRGIDVSLPFEAHISPAMKYLAHWIYADEGLQEGVTEKRLITKATEYLCPRRFEDRDEAENAARKFIEFCTGRAWVFTDTGTTKEGERLYQFTHRTFLEYFTAAYLVRTHPTPDTLMTILQHRIAKQEWDVVAQLAFQLQNKNVEGAGDELLTTLIEQVPRTESEDAWNLLSFTARCLEFIVPRPNVTREITKTCLEYSLLWHLEQSKKEKYSHKELDSSVHRESGEILRNLLYAATENRTTIANSLEKLLVERVKVGSESEALTVLGIGLYLFLFHIGIGRRGRVQDEVLDFWRSVSDHIFDSCADRIEILCPKHFWLCWEALWRGKVHLADLIKWYGVEGLFRVNFFTVFLDLGIRYSSLAQEIVDDVLLASDFSKQTRIFGYRKLVNCFELLKEAGYILPSYLPPWIRQQQIDLHVREDSFVSTSIFRMLKEYERQSGESPKGPLNLNSAILFGVFVLFAPLLELEGLLIRNKVAGSPSHLETLIRLLRKSKYFFLDFMRWTLLARFEQVATNKVQTEMDRCGFSSEQQNFLWRWIRKEIDLVQLEIAQEPLLR